MIQQALRTAFIPFALYGTTQAFAFGFFRQNWRNKEYAITERIKKCKASQQISSIISVNRNQLNIIHLTAILDRIEEEGMLNIQPIVDFVVNRLLLHREELLDIENARTLCNIACYLGNLKNTALNPIFLQANYSRILANRNTIETAMLITGLIRLGILGDILGTNQQSNSKKAVLLQKILTQKFTRQQILSIWYAYICEISNSNWSLNNHFHQLLAIIKDEDVGLKIYTYALVCYVRVSKTLKDRLNGPLREIITKEIPVEAKDHLLPYEFSLLLQSIKQLNNNVHESSEDKTVVFPSEFQERLVREFEWMCKRRNVTMRNVANGFKQFNEVFGATQELVRLSIEKFMSILVEEMTKARASDNYSLNYKIDLLSLCSLVWKLSERLQQISHLPNAEHNKIIFERAIPLIVSFMKLLKQKHLLKSLKNKEILMLYSGLAILKGKAKIQMNLDEEFIGISIQLVTSQDRRYSVKQIMFLFTYFKVIKIINQKFCRFINSSLLKKNQTEELTKDPKAVSLLEKKCIMTSTEKCLNCFQKPDISQTQMPY